MSRRDPALPLALALFRDLRAAGEIPDEPPDRELRRVLLHAARTELAGRTGARRRAFRGVARPGLRAMTTAGR